MAVSLATDENPAILPKPPNVPPVTFKENLFESCQF